MYNDILDFNNSFEYSDITGKTVRFYSQIQKENIINNTGTLYLKRYINLNEVINNNLINNIVVNNNISNISIRNIIQKVINDTNTYYSSIKEYISNYYSCRNIQINKILYSYLKEIIVINNIMNIDMIKNILKSENLKINLNKIVEYTENKNNSSIRCINSNKEIYYNCISNSVINKIVNYNILFKLIKQVKIKFNTKHYTSYNIIENISRNIVQTITLKSNLSRITARNYISYTKSKVKIITSLLKVIKVERNIHKNVIKYNDTYKIPVLKVNPIPIQFAV